MATKKTVNIQRLRSGCLVPLLSAVVWCLCKGFARTNYFKKLHLARPTPVGLGEALRREEVPTLSEEDLRTLETDGVVLVRGLVRDQETLIALRDSMWNHAFMPFESTWFNHKSWLYNGAVRAFLRDGPIGELMHQVFNDSPYVEALEAPIWGWQAVPNDHTHDWHVDSRPFNKGQMVSMWMILTDSEQTALEFVRGSHKARYRIEDDCAKVVPGEKDDFKMFNSTCVEGWQDVLKQELGLTGDMLFGPPMVAGDALLFSGHLLHRGFKRARPRLAVSARFRKQENHTNWPFHPGNGKCNFKHIHVYPRSYAETDANCAGWVVLPGRPDNALWLPNNRISQGLLWMLDKFL